MKFTFRQFMAAMKRIGLKPQEKAELDPRNSVIKASEKRHISAMEKGFFASAKKVVLLPHEKVAMKEAILGSSAMTSWWILRTKTFSSVVASLVILTMVGGGVSYAAESAVPGDTLYPVKIHFNEAMMQRLARSEMARARVDARRAERRLAEVETLIENDAMDDAKEELIQESLAVHMSAVRERMSALQSDEKVEELRVISAEVDAFLKERARRIRHANTKHMHSEILATVRAERVHAKKMEMSAALDSDEEILPPTPLTPTALLSASTEAAAIPVTLSTDAALTEEEEEELSMAAEARMQLMRERIEEMQTLEEEEEEVKTTTDETEEVEEEESESEVTVTDEEESDGKVVEPPADPVPTVREIKALLDTAEIQMNAGNTPEAVKAATSALENARKARKKFKKRRMHLEQQRVRSSTNIHPAASSRPASPPSSSSSSRSASVDTNTEASIDTHLGLR